MYCLCQLPVPQFAERARRSHQTFQAGDTGRGNLDWICPEEIQGVDFRGIMEQGHPFGTD